MAIWGYCRVSTVDQGESGLGLESQEAAVLRLHPEAVIVRDVLSGATPFEKRPGFLRIMAEAKSGDTLVVTSIDRIARTMELHLMAEAILSTCGLTLVSVNGEGTGDDSPTGVLLRRVCQSFSEYFRAVTKLRTKAAMKAKAARGEPVGRAPSGKAWRDGALIEDAAAVACQQDALVMDYDAWVAKHGPACERTYRRMKVRAGQWNRLDNDRTLR